ncbi:MAG: Flp pilus assembly protein CpaB [Candidatus Dormibacteria bacterium]
MAADGRARRLLVAGLAGAVASGAFAVVLVQAGRSTAGAADAGTTAALVAATNIAAGDPFTATNVTLAQYPVAALPPGAVYFGTTAALLGSGSSYASAALLRGQLILQTQVSSEVSPTKLPPVTLQRGNVAMSVPFDEARDSGGFIQEGDYIDILVDDPATAAVHYAFQGVHVLRVGDRSAQPAGGGATAAPAPALLLIEIPREQAAALAYAIDHNYSIRYVIRPQDAQTQSPLPNSAAVGASNWLSVVAG